MSPDTPAVHGALVAAGHDPWINDTGASFHMTGDKKWLRNYKPFKTPASVTVADDTKCPVLGYGTVVFKQGEKLISVEAAHYAPSFAFNLLSAASIFRFHPKFTLSFSATDCAFITPAGDKLLLGDKMAHTLWHVPGALPASDTMPSSLPMFCFIARPPSSSQASKDLSLWHRRCAHASPSAMRVIMRSTVGIPALDTATPIAHCPACSICQRNRDSFDTSEAIADRLLALVHIDIGYSDVVGVNGERYFMSFVDDHTRRLEVAFLKTRQGTEILQAMQQYVARMQAQCQHRVLRFHSDNEFDIRIIREWCAQQSIHQTFSTPYTPQMNGRAERVMRTIKNPARTMMLAAALPLTYWPYAVETVVYLRNRLPHRALKGVTPFERWFGRPPNVAHLRVFGCAAYPMLQEGQRESGPWTPRSRCGVFVGYSTRNTFAYKVLLPDTGEIIYSRDVKFDEENILNWGQQAIAPTDDLWQDATPPALAATDPPAKVNSTEPLIELPRPPSPPKIVDPEFDELHALVNSFVEEDDPKGGGTHDFSYVALKNNVPCLLVLIAPHVPPKVGQHDMCSVNGKAMRLRTLMDSADWPEWLKAAHSEHQSLFKMGALEGVAELPPGRKAIGVKWVFATKCDLEGFIARWKARLVAQGYSMKAGIDFSESFAPVVGLPTLRVLIALAMQFGLHITFLDVTTAYLNAEIEEEVFIRRPPLWDLFDSSDKSPYYRVRRALYGMKHSGREWYRTLTATLKKIGMVQLDKEPCVFVSELAILAVYVDDLLVITRTAADAEKFTNLLRKTFDMKVSPTSNAFIGLSIQRTPDSTFIHQQGYIRNVLKQFGDGAIGPAAMPMDPREDYLPHDGTTTQERRTMYLSKIGQCLWISQVSRPDIAYAVGVLCRYSANPSPQHFDAIDRVFRYLSNTINYGLRYTRDATMTDAVVHGYSDADHASVTGIRKSVSGMLLTIAGMTVAWRSKLQQSIVDSSTDAEYIALHYAARETVFLADIIDEMFFYFSGKQVVARPLAVHCDNAATIANVKETSGSGSVRYIDIKKKVLQQLSSRKTITVHKIGGKFNVADPLTKPLPAGEIERFRTMVNLVPVPPIAST